MFQCRNESEMNTAHQKQIIAPMAENGEVVGGDRVLILDAGSQYGKVSINIQLYQFIST